jgi:hypothetical protein
MIDFLGIGAQKSGTTWLYEHLAKHPAIAFPPGIKEMHFWDQHQDRGLAWYLAQFPGQKGKLSGEITPAYAILESEKIRLVHDVNPMLRLFYIMRDPRARAWSAALMEMTRAGKDFAATDDEWFIEQFFSDASLKRSDYATCIKNWLEVFPKGQLFLMKFSDIKDRPAALLQDLARHLGIDPAFYAPAGGQVSPEKIFSNPAHAPRPALRNVLQKIYGAQIESLNHYLGNVWFEDESSGWEERA